MDKSDELRRIANESHTRERKLPKAAILTVRAPHLEYPQCALTESERAAGSQIPSVLRAIADWHIVQSALDGASGAVISPMLHVARATYLREEADKLENGNPS